MSCQSDGEQHRVPELGGQVGDEEPTAGHARQLQGTGIMLFRYRADRSSSQAVGEARVSYSNRMRIKWDFRLYQEIEFQFHFRLKRLKRF